MEIWHDIIGFEGLYQVSNLGRVKSLYFGKERLLSAGKDKLGYLHVVLCKDGKNICYIHRLVAEAFIPNPNGYTEVNHKDEIKSNNVATNLEWCNRKYNINHGTRNDRVSKALSKPVYQYTMDGSLVGSYPSICEATRKTGYNGGNISLCCNGRIHHAYGYLWSYNLLTSRGRLF